MSRLLCLPCKSPCLSHQLAARQMRHLISHCSLSFQHLSFALNHSRLLLAARFRLPLSSKRRLLLSESGQARSRTQRGGDTQRPPDPRMNRLPEHFDRLSLGRRPLPSLLVTRPAKTVSCLQASPSVPACCNILHAQRLVCSSSCPGCSLPSYGSLADPPRGPALPAARA